MALIANKVALATKLQAVAGVYDPPNSTTDLYPISNLRLSIAGVTVQNNEYTGTIHLNGDEVAGKTVSGSFNINLRPPGGANPPNAGAFVPGRYLRAAKFAEVITATAIPAAAEALAAGTTTTGTLGAGAVGTAGLYKAMAIMVKNQGGTIKEQLTAIRAYNADKTMRFMQALKSSAAGSTYQIPRQLSYVRSIDESEPPFLSFRLWISGKRFDLADVSLSGLRLVIPASTRDQADIPTFEVQWTGTLAATADQSNPVVPYPGGTPLFKDGKLFLADKAVGGSNVGVDLGLRTAFPPNPNFPDGSEGGQLIESRASASMDRHAYLKAELDTLALADNQQQHALFAQWGYTPGNIVQIVVPDVRFNYQSPDVSGELVTENGDLFIDVFDRNVSINYPYPSVL